MIIKLVPYPDEHIYSFVRRLADANAIPFRMFLEYYFGKDRKRQIDYDMKEGFPTFCKQAFPNDNQADRFFELTTAPFDIIFLTEQNQSRFISNIFEPQTPLNNTLSIGVNNLRLCPQCLQEDIAEYGEAYFHRAHQLEGVRCCYKHNVPLMEYRKPRSRTAGYDLQDYTELLTGPQEQALQYARYAKDLLDAKLGVNLKEIQQYMLRRGFGLGMSSITQSNLFILGQNESWPKEYFYGEYVSPTKFLPILMVLAPSVEQLKSQLNESQLIDEYLCKCGNICYQGSWAHKNRLRVCHCMPYNDSNEMFVDMVKKIKGDAYEVCEEFHSIMTPIEILHRKCGHVQKYSPRNLLYGTGACPCEYIITSAEAAKKVAEISGFQLVHYKSTNEPVIIRAEECGHEFSCNFHKFLKSPFCRICQPKNMTPESYETRVQGLVGNEYTVVEPFVGQGHKVGIRHNLCGKVQYYKPSAFLDGQRCKKCGCTVSGDKLNQYLQQYSHGRYEITESIENGLIIRDNETQRTIRLTSVKILQEILRPTPSDVLPVVNPDKTIKITSAWDDALQLLKEYLQERPIESIIRETRYKDFGLGQWIKAQRAAWKKGELSQERIQRLEEVGFLFTKRASLWTQNYYVLVDIYPNQKVTRDTVYNGVPIGMWLKNQKNFYYKGSLSWERIDLMQKIDINLLQKPGEVNILAPETKHIKIHYDSQNEQYLLRPNHQLIIPTDIMTDKMNWKEDGSEFIIQLKNSTDDELDRIRQFLTGTGCNILLHAESFYLPLELSTFKSPTKYKPGWHIENGIMYVTDKKLEQLVFSDTIYQLHNMKKDI